MKKHRAILFALIFCGTAAATQAQLINAIKAVVHDSLITSQEVELPALAQIQDLKKKYANQPQVLEAQFAKTLDENLDQLLERELILHEFKTAGYSFPESAIEEQVQKRLRSDFGGDRARLTKTLQAEGITYEKYRQQIRERMIVVALTDKNIAGEIMISPHKIETYYVAHTEDFKMQDKIRLRMIVLNAASPEEKERAKKIAGEIAVKLKDGAAFSEMADVYSNGRNPGGDWGWADRTELRKELVPTAFALKAGEISEVVETPEACFLMLVEEKRPAHIKALGEVRDEIEKNMLIQERDRLHKKWIERLKKKTFVRHY